MALNCILVLLCLTTLCYAKGVLDDEQEIAVQNVFRHILKLQPPVGGVVNRVAKPPKHMMELYQKYSNAGGFKQTTGNTVRSILPTVKGSSPATQMLVFNVTCVDESEEVNLAQLHLHRRRLPRVDTSNRHRRILAPPYRVRIFQVLGHRSRVVPLASLPVSQHTRGGWHSLDITAVLRELLLSTSSSTLQLGVRFEAPKNRPISHDHFLKTTSNETSAFLVVFSDDNGLLTDETRALNPVRHTHALATMLQQNTGRMFESFTVKNALKALHEDASLNRTNDDFYLESGDKDQTSVTSTGTAEEHNNFESFLKEKKKIGTKKSQLDSPKRTPAASSVKSEESDNMIFDEASEEEKISRWLTKEDLQEQPKKTVKKFGAPRYRRIHPKTRYRVRPRNDIDASSEEVEKRSARSTYDEADLSSQGSTLITEGENREGKVGGRMTRSIVDNELPELASRGGEIPKTSPQTLLKTRDSQDPARRHASKEIPLPTRSSKRWRGGGGGGSGRKRGRGKKRENKKKGKKGVENWHQSVEQQSNEEWHENFAKIDKDGTSTCHMNKLVVDFVDIGWSDWIISPQKFEAHYCIGQCVYPLTKALKPTNHATIQSLVHLIDQHSEVPDPCCVPDKLSPMSLLYLDDNNNVVLRSYRDMTVESCACR